MKNCHYCGYNKFESHAYDCPVNRAFDTRHANALLEPEFYFSEPTYGQRLQDGFDWLHQDEEYITDKFGNTRPSGY